MAIAGRLHWLNAKSTCCLLIAIWAYAFWPTITNACHAYLHSGFDYQGFLVLPVLLMLMMRNSAYLKRTSAVYKPLGLIYLLLFATLWLLATIVELDIPRQIAILSMLIAIVLTTCGKRVTSILLLPFSCLYFLLPIGQPINTALQEVFAWGLMQALMIAKQSVYWEGDKIFANNHAYDIYAYLSSMHHALLFLILGAGYAMLRTRTVVTTIYIAASFIVMPFCILWLALYSYILLNQWITMTNFIENNITAIGWCLTLFGLISATLLGLFLSDRKNVIGRSDDIAWRENYLSKGKNVLKPVILASCILLLMPIIAQTMKNNISYNDATLPQVPNTASFRKDQNLVKLAISHQPQQLDHSWKKIKESNKKIKLAQHKMPVHETVFHNAKNKYKINWSVNYINGHFTTNPTVTKALTQLYNLSKQEIKSGIITLSTDTTAELGLARDRLKEFLQDFTESEAVRISS